MDARWDPRSAAAPSGVLRTGRGYAAIARSGGPARGRAGHTRGRLLVGPGGARPV